MCDASFRARISISSNAENVKIKMKSLLIIPIDSTGFWRERRFQRTDRLICPLSRVFLPFQQINPTFSLCGYSAAERDTVCRG